MKIYLSGKISGITFSEAERKFIYFEKNLTNKGFTVVNPLKIEPFLGLNLWICYMIADIWQMLKCDAVILLPDWEDSRGARIECRIAEFRNMQIFIAHDGDPDKSFNWPI